MTDIITFILSIFFLFRGASRGFINSLMIPFSIIVATIISIIYYQFTKDVITSLVIGLLGPILITFVLKLLLKKWAKATNSEIGPSILSRLGGALLTLAWGWIFIVFALILLASLPKWGAVMESVHDDVIRSASYFFAKPLGERIFASAEQTAPSATGSAAPSTNDAKTLAEDPRFQEVLKDPDIQKEIDAHDIVKLMSNPKMMDLTRQIMSDPATMKKVMALYSHQTASQSIFASSDSSN